MDRRTLGFLFAVIGACGGDKGDSDGTSGGDGSSGTLGMSSTPTTGAPPEPTTGADPGTSTSGDVTGADPTGGPTAPTSDPSDATTGTPVDPQANALCQALCDRGPRCGLRPGGQACVDTCLAGLETPDAECRQAGEQVLECVVELACAQFVPFVESGDFGPCVGQAEHRDLVCELGDCDVGGGIGDAGGCELTKQCPDAPLARLECDEATCTCFVGDDSLATCEVEDACESLKTMLDRAAACCGF